MKLQALWIKLNGIKDGDEVEVTRAASKGEMGWCGNYYDVTRAVGKKYTINDTLHGPEMRLGINLSSGPIFPYFCLRPVKQETYSRGQRFLHGTDIYVIASCSTTNAILASLINTLTGCPVTYPVKVDNILEITQEEFSALCNRRPDNFKLISE